MSIYISSLCLEKNKQTGGMCTRVGDEVTYYVHEGNVSISGLKCYLSGIMVLSFKSLEHSKCT